MVGNQTEETGKEHIFEELCTILVAFMSKVSVS